MDIQRIVVFCEIAVCGFCFLKENYFLAEGAGAVSRSVRMVIAALRTSPTAWVSSRVPEHQLGLFQECLNINLG